MSHQCEMNGFHQIDANSDLVGAGKAQHRESGVEQVLQEEGTMATILSVFASKSNNLVLLHKSPVPPKLLSPL